jgi:hypothetical protein
MLPNSTKPTLSGTSHLTAIQCHHPRSDLGFDPIARVISVEANYHRLPPIHTARNGRAEDGLPAVLCTLETEDRRSVKV